MAQQEGSLIKRMKSEGMRQGSLVEIIISPDAVWDVGNMASAWPTPPPNIFGFKRYDPDGHVPDERSGKKVPVSGYVVDIKENRIYLKSLGDESQAARISMRQYYIENDVILSYTIHDECALQKAHADDDANGQMAFDFVSSHP